MTVGEPIRILLVDDHEMVRRGLTVFIEAVEDLVLIGEAANGREAIDFLENNQADVIMMDLLMPEMGGLEAIKVIRNSLPEQKIIAMTSFEDDELVTNALGNGAIGFLMKNASIDELAQAIRNAHQGKSTLSPEAAKILINGSGQNNANDLNLTSREKEVLKLMVDGLTNPEIADKLSIERSTVKSHVSNILGKLNVSSRVESVKIALELNLI